MTGSFRRLIPAMLVIGISAGLSGTSIAQQASAVLPEMEALSFLIGEWEGTAWIQRGPERTHLIQRETVTPLLGGEVLLVRGRGVFAQDTTEVGHEAVAMIGYDSSSGTYVMRSFLPGGRTAAPSLSVNDTTIVWSIGTSVRYTITLDEAGRWFEVGEFSNDGGESWTKFLEMTLVRSEAPD